jgi:hypothetical protein
MFTMLFSRARLCVRITSDSLVSVIKLRIKYSFVSYFILHSTNKHAEVVAYFFQEVSYRVPLNLQVCESRVLFLDLPITINLNFNVQVA